MCQPEAYRLLFCGKSSSAAQNDPVRISAGLPAAPSRERQQSAFFCAASPFLSGIVFFPPGCFFSFQRFQPQPDQLHRCFGARLVPVRKPEILDLLKHLFVHRDRVARFFCCHAIFPFLPLCFPIDSPPKLYLIMQKLCKNCKAHRIFTLDSGLLNHYNGGKPRVNH